MSENVAKIRRTITDLGYAPITALDENGKPTYGNVVWFAHHEAGGRAYDAQPAGQAQAIWADGREVYSFEDNQGYNTTLTTIGVTDDIDEAWYGRTVLQDGSAEEYANGAEYPGFALVIIEDTTDKTGETTIFFNCHINQRSGKQGATSEGSGINPQFPEHNIACRPRLDCAAVCKRIPGKTKITTIPEPSMAAPHVHILENTAAVAVAGTKKLTISSVLPADASITWTSSATGKATVASDGTVTGVSAGSATITASITVSGTAYTDTCTVVVT